VKAALLEPQLQAQMYGKDSIIRFDEGLIGFNEFKHFVLVETEEVKPFRVLQSADSTEVAVVVLDPRFRIADYYNQVPAREWEAIGVTDPANRLAFVIVNIGLNPREITANFQAPILVNYQRMTGRQVILTDTGFGVRMALVI
jgi:flagellar assembly factor FliW